MWPLHGGQRFIFPLLPALAAFFVAGFEFLESYFQNYKVALKLVALVPILFSIVLFNSGITILRDGVKRAREGSVPGGAYTPEAQDFFAFIREKTKKEDAVAFFKPRALRLMTGRQSWAVTGVSRLSDAQYLGMIDGWSDYQPPRDELQKLIQAGSLRSVYAKSPYILYEIVH